MTKYNPSLDEPETTPTPQEWADVYGDSDKNPASAPPEPTPTKIEEILKELFDVTDN